jgi:hypothetical protein
MILKVMKLKIIQNNRDKEALKKIAWGCHNWVLTVLLQSDAVVTVPEAQPWSL